MSRRLEAIIVYVLTKFLGLLSRSHRQRRISCQDLLQLLKVGRLDQVVMKACSLQRGTCAATTPQSVDKSCRIPSIRRMQQHRFDRQPWTESESHNRSVDWLMFQFIQQEKNCCRRHVSIPGQDLSRCRNSLARQ